MDQYNESIFLRNISLEDSLLAFKSARYFSSQKMSVIQHNADDASSLSAFPFFSAEELEGLKAEHSYSVPSQGTNVAPNLRCLDWWN